MRQTDNQSKRIRLAEVMAALSVATDLGTGQPMEFAMSSCLLAVRLGKALGYETAVLRDVYYEALLRYIGCNAETHILAALAGDELVARAEFAKIDVGQPNQVVRLVTRLLQGMHAGATQIELDRMVAQEMARVPELAHSFVEHCEVAQQFGQRLGFGEKLIQGLGQLYERWDGKGLPNGVAGQQIAPQVRVVSLAQDVVVFYRLGGAKAAVEMVRERRGGQYEPRIADLFCEQAEELLWEFEEQPEWETILGLEPGAAHWLDEGEFDRACEVLADFTDMKSYYTYGHSRGVAELAAAAAKRRGMTDEEVRTARRAGWLHDLGRTGISIRIWDKPSSLTEREWEKVRLHPYYTERILAQATTLRELGMLGSLHHERLDGSGYYRALPAAMLDRLARILAAADVYRAMREERPYRAALKATEAAGGMRAMVRAGKLDGEAVEAVLAAAGHAVSTKRRERVAGLTAREVEVLRLVARGNSIKEIASALTVSNKTVDTHIQHIYEKIGVSTRAAAALWAVEHEVMV